MHGPLLPAPRPDRRDAPLTMPGDWQPTVLGALALALGGLGAMAWLAPGAWPLPGPTTLLHGRCIGAMQFGRICMKIIRQLVAPMVVAASTNSCSLRLSATARTIRARFIHPSRPIINTIAITLE